MKKVIGIIRVSTKEQKTNGNGLDMQEKSIREYCKKNNLDLVKIIDEGNVSGDTPLGMSLEQKRPILVKALKEAKKIGVQNIVVYKTDRLWRGYRSIVYIQDLLYSLGLQVISVNEPNYKLGIELTAHEEFLMTVEDAMTVMEKKTIVKRMKEGKDNKRKQGYRVGGIAPYGYKYDSKKHLVKNKKESEILLYIKEISQSGMSFTEMVNHLKELGFVTRNKVPFSRASIHQIVNNPVYKGILIIDGKEIKGQHEPYWD